MTKIISNSVLRLSVSIAALSVAAGSAFAQTPSLDEVIVTAQKRSANQQDVPVSVAAISFDELEGLTMDSPDDVAAQVSNMQVSAPIDPVQPIFILRGISMSDYSINQNSPIGVYGDEAYLGATYLHGLSMFDVERLEVLKGPQGTLYGKNTTGGAINIITRTPQIDDVANGYVKLGYGRFNEISAAGAVEGTLVEGKLAARAAFNYKKDDGYWENALGGPDLAQTDNWAGRLTLNFQPSDTVNFVLKAQHGESSPRGRVPRAEGLLGPGSTNIAGTTDPAMQGLHSGSSDTTGITNAKATSFNLKTTIELGSHDLIGVSSYYDGEYFVEGQDVDGTGVDLATIDWLAETEAYSQDIRLQSNLDGRLNYIVGAYYGFEDVDTAVNNRLFNTPLFLLRQLNPAQAALFESFGDARRQIDVEKKSLALYGNVDFELSDRATLRAGLRYTKDKNTRDNYRVHRYDAAGNPIGSWVSGGNPRPIAPGVDAPLIPPGAPPICLPMPTPFCNTGVITAGPFQDISVPERSVTEKEFSGNISLDYDISDNAMLYASYSRGFRAGAWNGGLFYADNANENGAYANPEFVDAFEAGIKSELLDNRVRLNVAGFFYDYKDQQFINQVGISGLLVNAGGAEIKGVEADLLFAATDDLTIRAGLGLLDTEYTELALAELGTPNPADNVDLAGNELINAPKTNFNFGIDYEKPISDQVVAKLNLDGNYQSKQWYSAYNDFVSPANPVIDYSPIKQDAYWVFNGRVTFANADDTMALSFWGKNLFDEDYDVYAISLAGGFGFNYFQEADPRRYGAEFTYKF